MLIKERNLVPVFTGSDGDALQSPINGGIRGLDSLSWSQGDLLDLDRQGRKSRYLPIEGCNTENYLGYQRFSATERPRPAFNDCRNTKDLAINLPFTIVVKSTRYPEMVNFWGYRRWPTGVTKGTYGNPALTTSRNLFASRAWWEMRPRFEGKTQMLNFIYELKDFKALAKSMAKLIKLARRGKVLEEISRLRRNFAKKVKDHPTRTLEPTLPASEAWLTNQMAIKPLMSDFTAIMENLMQPVLQAQNEFSDLGDQVQTSHYTEQDWHDSDLVVIPDGSYNGYWWWTPFLMRGWSASNIMTATMRYDYTYRARNKAEAFMKYWGLNMTGEVLWNMIPMSFLIDYFVKISQSLHAMDVDKNVDVNTYDYSESVLSIRQDGVFLNSAVEILGSVVDGVYYPPGHQTGVLISGFSESYYRRDKCWPNKGVYVPLVTKSVSDSHMLNMAALARCFM